MFGIIGIIVFVIVISLYIFLFVALILTLNSKIIGAITKAFVCAILIFLIASPLIVIIPLRRTPAALPINDVINITDESQQLTIVAVEMPAPDYLSGEGIIEKKYSSTVTVHVKNNSDQQVCLGLRYYANSGSIGPYSPGASSTSRVLAIDANWAGDLQFPIRHHRFVKGGNIQLSLVKCEAKYSGALVLPPGSKPLFEKKYYMVSEK